MPAETPEIPRLLKMTQVAEILQVSRTQAYRLAASGELPSVRFGGATIRVRFDDLKRFIEEHAGTQADSNDSNL